MLSSLIVEIVLRTNFKASRSSGSIAMSFWYWSIFSVSASMDFLDATRKMSPYWSRHWSAWLAMPSATADASMWMNSMLLRASWAKAWSLSDEYCASLASKKTKDGGLSWSFSKFARALASQSLNSRS